MTQEQREAIVARLRGLDDEAKLRLLDRIADFVADVELTDEEADQELRAAGLDPGTVGRDLRERLEQRLAQTAED